jgi:predicted O-linked N-acetylglucosamine transferase (SPINDLY family)
MHSQTLAFAHTHAQAGRFAEMLSVCQSLAESANPAALLEIGALLSSYGFLSQAQQCFQRVLASNPNDLSALGNLANLAAAAGNHAAARNIYAELLTKLPDHPIVRRNALTSLEYDPAASDAQRLNQAKAWGEWAVAKAGGFLPRPKTRTTVDQPLRIGYVSADFCQHTVGLFIKDVLTGHQASRVRAFAYHAGGVRDWVTEQIAGSCTLRGVSQLDDAALVQLIRSDAIDVLVDLSGHTAGSRLTAFAYRPAPVMVSWLGYFASTGLSYMDAVLLDEWHAPHGAESQFTEPIIRLSSGRLCYQPVPFAPDVSLPPCERNGFITFGSFNNTAKLNAGVYDVWARVLLAVPQSRLVLKWRTFNDQAFQQSVTQQFALRGIEPDRIELRGPSFHADVLKQYADIDIALDPFPFTGGLTSCEALWMGVPVVTLPKSSVVSRQTFAFLTAIDQLQWIANDETHYIHIAQSLASKNNGLSHIRATLREAMRSSSLMDLHGFTHTLENTFYQLYEKVKI